MTCTLHYRRGELATLRRVRRWLLKCWEGNVDFQVQFPRASRYQRLTAKYAALTQESHVRGLDKMIAEKKAQIARILRRRGRNES